MRSLRREMQIFSYKFSVLKIAITTPKYTRMHHFDAIFQKFPGETPLTPTCGRGHPAEGGDPSPFSVLRASVKPSASSLRAPAVFNRVPEEKKLDTPEADPPNDQMKRYESTEFPLFFFFFL